jgi:hypothetical protein
MSNTDSFIDEVTEEVRRDRLYGLLRRYGWIAALVIIAIVGGAAFVEYRKAQARASAETFGDRILEALASDTPLERQTGLTSISARSAGAEAVLSLLAAAEAQEAGDIEGATTLLDALAVNGEVPEIYRSIASFKALVLKAETMDPDNRRQQLEALAQPGAPLSLLAQEQLALQDIAEGARDAAIARFQAIAQDAGVSADLQQRAVQMIVALGGTPDATDAAGAAN